jgi:hypothetical protein
MSEVWTMDRYRSVGAKPAEYLLQGEALVHHRETLLTLAGDSLSADNILHVRPQAFMTSWPELLRSAEVSKFF